MRDWAEDDADRMLDMYSRDDVVRFLGSVPTPMRTREQALDRIARGRTRNAEQPPGSPCGWWALEVRDSGVVAGSASTCARPGADHRGAAREEQRQGRTPGPACHV